MKKQPADERTKASNRPVHEIRFGSVKATIWCNQTDAGPMYNVTVSRFYRAKDSDGNEVWRDSDSFGRSDLLELAKAIDLAHTWVCSQ